MADSSSAGKICIICEQGDLGLYGDPLSEEDQKKYNNQIIKESKKDEDRETEANE